MKLTLAEIKSLADIFPGNCLVYKLVGEELELLAMSEGGEQIGARPGKDFLQYAGNSLWANVFKNDRRFLREAILRSLQEGSAECIYRFGQELQDDFVWLHTIVKNIGELADCPVVALTFRNASERNEAQLELLEDMDTSVYVCDVETQELLYANRAAMKNSRCKGNYSGHTCYNYMFGKNHICEDCQLKHLQLNGKQELVRHDKDGDRYLNIEKKGITWYGHFACAHFINDVTEKKRNERMLAVEREASAKAAFVSNVSHDMRTPLNGILGFIELAMQSEGQEKREEYLEKIRTTGRFMLNLINETLDLSKISSGKLMVEPENSNMQELLDTIIVSAYANAEVKNVQFITELTDMHFQDVFVDALKLQKVILNLLSNAIKYTPEGGTVTMCMEGPADFGAFNCHISISDTGVGMDKAFLPRIFEPFAQERTSITRKIEGTGLGMSIVKSLVDLLGGKITVDSEPGKGTRFDIWFYLPPGQQGEPRENIVDHDVLRLTNRRILLCEDNEINRELLQSLLAFKGVEVIAAGDGQQGVAAFASSPEGSIDAVLMDLRMPIMDGLEATRAIRAMSRDDARKVPIFALTGEVDEVSVHKARAAGMNECLPKPVDIPLLLHRLAAVM